MAEPTDDKVKKIYTALTNGGNNLGTEEQFRTAVSDPNKRKKIFDALSTQNNLGTYEQFSGAVETIPKLTPQQTMKVPTTSMMESLKSGMSGAGELIPSQTQNIQEASTSQLAGSTSGLETSPLGITKPSNQPLIGKTLQQASDQGYVPELKEDIDLSQFNITEEGTVVPSNYPGQSGFGIEEKKPEPKNWMEEAVAKRKSDDVSMKQRLSSSTIDEETGEGVYSEEPTFEAKGLIKNKYGFMGEKMQGGEKYFEAPSSNTYEESLSFMAKGDTENYLPLSRGIDFWSDTKKIASQQGYADKNFDVLGTNVRGNKLPQEMSKVFSDYETQLKRSNPEKYKEIVTISNFSGKRFKPEQVYGYDQEKNTWYVKPEFQSVKHMIQGSAEDAQKRGVVVIEDAGADAQINYLKEALEHQDKLINADFNARTNNGKTNPQYEDGTTALSRYKDAKKELTRISTQVLDNSEYTDKIEANQRQYEKALEEQKMADDTYEQFYKEMPIMASIYYNVSDPLIRATTSVPRKIFSVPSILGIDLPEFESKEKEARQFEKDVSGVKPTELQKSIFERQLNIIPNATQMIADIWLMGKGGRVLEGAGMATRPAFFTSTVINTYSDIEQSTYDQLKASGVSESKAKEASHWNGLFGSLFAAGFEGMFPGMEKIIAGGAKKQVSEELIKGLAKGESVKEIFSKVGKSYLKELPKEQAEEILTMFTDKMVNAKTNYDLGGDYLDADIHADEIAETMIMTAIPGAFAEMRNFKTPNGIQKAALFEALSDEKNFTKSMNSALEKGMITPEQAKKMTTDIEELKSVVKGIPDLKIESEKGMDLVMNLYKKKQIKEADKGAYVDDKFSPMKEKATNDKLAEIDAEIDEIVKVPEVVPEEKKEGKVRETSFVNDVTGENGTKPKEPEFNITDGHHRFIAYSESGAKEVPAVNEKGEEVMVPIEQLRPTQPLEEKDRATIEGLKQSIAKGDVIEPIKVEEVSVSPAQKSEETKVEKTEPESGEIKVKSPQITITNNEGAKELKLDDKFYSEKEFNELLDKPEIIKGINGGTIAVSVNNPSTEIQTKLETLKTKPDVKEQAKTEAGEEAVLTETSTPKTEAGEKKEKPQEKAEEVAPEKKVESIPPIEPPKIEPPKTEKPEGEKKERGGWDKNLKQYPDLEAFKNDPIRYYETTTNQLQVDEANAILDFYPVEQWADRITDTSLDITGDIRSVLSQVAMKRLSTMSREAKKEGNPELAQSYVAQELKIAKQWKEKKTLAAKELQAADVNNYLSPEARKLEAKETIEEANAYTRKQAEPKAKKIKTKVDKEAEDSATEVDNVMNNQGQQEQEPVETPKPEKEEKFKFVDISKNKVFTQKAVDEAKKKLKELRGRMNDVSSIVEHAKPIATIMSAYAEAGVRSFAELSKRITKDIGKGFESSYYTAYKNVRESFSEAGEKEGFSTDEMIEKELAEQEKDANLFNLSAKQKAANKKKVFTEGIGDDIKTVTKKVASRVVSDAMNATDNGINGSGDAVKTFINKVVSKSRDFYKNVKGKDKSDALAYAIDNFNPTKDVFGDAKKEVFEELDKSDLSEDEKDAIREYLNEYEKSIFDSVLTQKNKDNIINDAIKESGYVKANGQADWSKLIFENKNNQEAIIQKIKDAILKKGVDEETANSIANGIAQRFYSTLKDKTTKMIEKEFKSKKKANSKKSIAEKQRLRSAAEKLLSGYRNAGLKTKDIIDALSPEFGVKNLTDKEMDQLDKLIEELEDAEGFHKVEVLEKINYMIQSKVPGFAQKVFWDRMYARLLGGPITLLKNMTGFFEVVSNQVGAAFRTGNLKLLNPVGKSSGIFRDILVRGGTAKGENIYTRETSNTDKTGAVRRLEFAKSRIPILRWIKDQEKYIGRIMDATDAVNQQMVANASLYEFVRASMKKADPTLSNKEANRKAYEAVYGGDIKKAEEEAKKYFKDRKKNPSRYTIRRRANEILRSKINNDLIEKAEIEGADALFKGEADMTSLVGSGFISKLLSGAFEMSLRKLETMLKEGTVHPTVIGVAEFMIKAIKFKLLPFVTGVSNIVEKGLEKMFPYAIAKAGLNAGLGKINKDEEKRAEYYRKAKILTTSGALGGTATLGMMMLLSVLSGDDEEEMFDDKNKTMNLFGTKVSYDYLGSLAVPLKVWSAMNEYKSPKTAEVFDPENPTGREKNFAQLAFESIITEASQFQGIGDLYRATFSENPDNGFMDYFKKQGADLLATAAIPFKQTESQFYQMYDREQKHVDGFWEELLKAGGATRAWLNNPSLDYQGRPVQTGEKYRSSAPGFITMLKGGKEQDENKVDALMIKYDLTAETPRRITASLIIKDGDDIRYMSNDEHYIFSYLRGKLFSKFTEDMIEGKSRYGSDDDRLKKIVESGSPRNAEDKKQVKKIISKQASAAKKESLKKIQELISKGDVNLDDYNMDDLDKLFNEMYTEYKNR